MEHNPAFVHATNQHRFLHRNFAEEQRKRTSGCKNKVASLTNVATFNVFDVEVGLFMFFVNKSSSYT